MSERRGNRVKFYRQGDPSGASHYWQWVDPPTVPRVGDHVKLATVTYRVIAVGWLNEWEANVLLRTDPSGEVVTS